MTVLSHLSAEARAECLAELPWGGLLAVAAKHGLEPNALYRARHEHFGVKPPKSARPIELPSPTCRKWSLRRKHAVVVALRREEITVAEVLERYAMASEELDSWRSAYAEVSAAGLEVVQKRRTA